MPERMGIGMIAGCMCMPASQQASKQTSPQNNQPANYPTSQLGWLGCGYWRGVVRRGFGPSRAFGGGQSSSRSQQGESG